MSEMTLRAGTRRGRNHIDRHGETWDLVGVRDSVLFDDRPGPWLLLSSRVADFLLWVRRDDDADHSVA